MSGRCVKRRKKLCLNGIKTLTHSPRVKQTYTDFICIKDFICRDYYPWSSYPKDLRSKNTLSSDVIPEPKEKRGENKTKTNDKTKKTYKKEHIKNDPSTPLPPRIPLHKPNTSNSSIPTG